ncbi:MAG: Crp/Fnr family transcriptional regulator [Nitrospirae bacterium]|nr:Crp/Fnr family transcriptional regulator [Nitrospirota bacterium]
MDTASKIEHLKRMELFSSLSTEDLLHVGDKIFVKQYKKNDTILFKGDTNNNIYIIFDGEVKVSQSTEDGKEVILFIHQSGEIFGETSWGGRGNNPSLIAATKDTLCAVISMNELYSIMLNNNDILERLINILSSRLCQSWELIQMLNSNHAPHRIKTLLIMLAKRYEKNAREETILNIRLTHQSIANMTGLTRETVTRVIDVWLRKGEISTKNKFIQLNPAFLQSN